MRNLFAQTDRDDDEFKVRSSERDGDTDRQRVDIVMNAIEEALHAAESEQKGLSQRVEEVLARAASETVGNASDEYLQREPLDSHHQNLFSEEISKWPEAAELARRLDLPL